MPVEQLLKNPINARDFQPLPEAQPMSARQKFEDLKKTEFYDNYRKMWRKDKDDLNFLPCNNQLLSIVIEGMFDKEKAQADYEYIKEDFHKRGIWDWHISGDGFIAETGNQLLAVLAECTFDKDKARQSYTKLKNSQHYDPELEQWNHVVEMHKKGVFSVKKDRHSDDQLLGVLAEGIFDKEKAREHYEALKQTPLYDKQSGLWLSVMTKNQEKASWGNSLFSQNQLLAILVDEVFDKKRARRRYEELKQTAFYQDDTWIRSTNPSGPVAPFSHDQLLGIFIEATLKPEFTPDEQIPVPEVRVF